MRMAKRRSENPDLTLLWRAPPSSVNYGRKKAATLPNSVVITNITKQQKVNRKQLLSYKHSVTQRSSPLQGEGKGVPRWVTILVFTLSPDFRKGLFLKNQKLSVKHEKSVITISFNPPTVDRQNTRRKRSITEDVSTNQGLTFAPTIFLNSEFAVSALEKEFIPHTHWAQWSICTTF